MDERICQAISSMQRIEFIYDGMRREVEPYAHGISKTGKAVMRGYQIAGESSDGKLGWKLWSVHKMGSLSLLDSTFANIRPEYVRGDSHMTSIFCEL